ncbi:MAG: hypothetical protein ACRENG_06275 [bacterium]
MKKIENQFLNLGGLSKVPVEQKAKMAGGQEKRWEEMATEMSMAFKLTR